MKKNFVFTGVSVASRLLTSLFLFVLLARLWGPEEFGAFSFLFSLTTILALIVDFGFQGFLLREVAADHERGADFLADAVRAKIFLSVPFFCFSMAALYIVRVSSDLTMAILLVFAAAFVSFSELYVSVLRAVGRYDVETLVVSAWNLCLFIVAAGAAYLGARPIHIALVLFLSRFIQAIALSRLVNRLLTCKGVLPRRARTPLKDLLRKAAPYGFDSGMVVAWGHIDMIAVRVIFGVHSAGVYAAGQKLVQGLCALAPIVGNVMIPTLSNQAKNHPDKLVSAAYKTMVFLSLLGVLLAALLYIFSGYVIEYLLGSEYSSLDDLLLVFCFLLTARYIAAAVGVVLTSIGLQGKKVVSQILALCMFFLGVLACYVFSFDMNGFVAVMICVSLVSIVSSSFFLKVSQWRFFSSKGDV
jgi:O-antigen/teichoic acid export membrane protein